MLHIFASETEEHHKRSAELADEGKSLHVLRDIRNEVHEQLVQGLFTEEQISAAREEYEEKKKLEVVGTRANAKAAVADAVHTSTQLANILQTLYLRTGVIGLLLLSKAHVDDSFTHTLIEVNGSSTFFYSCFKRPADEVMRSYEQFICSRVNDLPKANSSSVPKKQSDVAELIKAGLEEITAGACTTMSYTKYDKLIRARHAVELVGWPDGVEFKAPKKISNTASLTLLLSALADKSLRWEPMTEDDVVAVAKTVAESEKEVRDQTTGRGINKDGTLRKKRVSGKTSKRKAPTDDEGASPKRRKGKSTSRFTKKLPPAPRSQSILSNTDTEDGGSENESSNPSDEDS
ncbi:hypothetical protein CVT24_006544 [Panaeolus cyanescens]|uniref:Uncharacterized protein n=1 Tax=Panaeolus cyanescens TaxID=181874 RepID=A0A409WNM8_9AGAR|nr:hypothetical protein CVT24_006544 [Panaeolus cyanescens]